MTSTQLTVEGMTCAHCVRAVTQELGELAGVTGVDVRLVPDGLSRVEVTSTDRLDDAAVRAAVAEAGYEVVTGG